MRSSWPILVYDCRIPADDDNTGDGQTPDTVPDQPARPARTERAPAPRLVSGEKVGRYQIIAELGAGGMGVVYLAHDADLGRHVALKVVTAAGARSELQTTRLQREAQALAQLSHPNVIAVYEVGRLDGGVFVAMEYVDGQRLDDWLHERPRGWREVLRVFRDAGKGLEAAHDAALVHRDFKPANLMIGRDGRVRVLDFGLARAPIATPALGVPTRAPAAAGDDVTTSHGEARAPESAERQNAAPEDPVRQSAAAEEGAPVSEVSPSISSGRLLDSPLTQAGMVVGTPPYMAPEQHLGRGADARSDQFAFCVAFYQALYGERPFAGGSYQQLVDNITQGRVRPAPAGSRVPGWIRQVLLKGLAVAPEARYPSMAAILHALAHDPAARWRRAGTAAAVLALVGLAGFGFWRRAQDPCGGAAAAFSGAWDPARKQAVLAAFTATGKPYAADAFRSVERALDDFTRDWSAMRVSACEATRVRGEQSPELLNLRMACLDGRRGEVRALTDVFAAADATVVERAPEAARSLVPLAACADAAALRARVPPPADVKVRARVEALRGELERAAALWESGRYADGLKVAAPAAAAARETRYRPVEAEALLLLGRLQESSGDYPSAGRSLRDAQLAAEAGRHDELAARAGNDLVWLTGERLGKYADAHELARDAEARIERLGTSELLRADLYAKEGAIYLEEGKYDQALDYARRALALREHALSPENPAIGSALGDVADVELQKADYDHAVADYRRALALLEKALGPRHPKVASLLINLGGALRLEGRRKEALAEYERARGIIEVSLGPKHPMLATLDVNVGDVLETEGRYEEALAAYERALDAWQKALGPEHPNVATARYHLGSVALEQGRPEEARADFERALAIWQKALGAEHPSLSAALDGIGDALLAEGQPARALELYQRALAIGEKALGPKHPDLAEALTGIGLAELALGQPRRALTPLERALALREADPADPLGLARTRFGAARALAETGGGARARTLALAAREAWAKARPDAKAVGEIDRWLASHR